ncbi:MAG: hypothetical protein V1734_07010 [Nanoarchaeota archaeon]
MGEVLHKHPGMKREKGYLYFVDKKGNMARAAMARGGGKKKSKPKQEVMCKCGLKRESGWLYYVDKAMNTARAKMAKPGRKK